MPKAPPMDISGIGRFPAIISTQSYAEALPWFFFFDACHKAPSSINTPSTTALNTTDWVC